MENTTLNRLQAKTTEKRSYFSRQQILKKSVLDRTNETSEKIEYLKSEADILDRVTILLNSIGETRQQEAQAKIEGIVTNGLQSIFGEDYSFHINQTMKGKNASVDFTVRTRMGDSIVETGVLDSHGGGLASVIGFLLRLTVLLLDKRERNKLIVGDEVFAAVSREYLDPLAEFVKEIVEKTDIQFLLITHSPEWSDYADITYKFGNKNGVTHVTAE